MDETENQQGFYYIIPAQLVESGNHLKALVYGLITTLVSNEGYCYASNKYIAKKLGRKDDSIISTQISELETEGWITTEIGKANARKIWLTNANPLRKYPTRGLRKNQATSTEISDEGSTEISEESNTSVSNKSKVIMQAKPAGEGEASDDYMALPERINTIIEKFQMTVNPVINYGNKTSRSACQYLIKTYGFKKALSMAEYACQIQLNEDRFAPVIQTPYQLKEKVGQLFSYAQKNKNRGRMEAV